MMIEVLKSKIHCARVTEANLNYMGSITFDGCRQHDCRREGVYSRQ